MRNIPESKLRDVGTTIFTVMSKMAADHGAIDLSQGFPDFDCPERLKELVALHLNANRNQYPPMTGIPELRREIADKVKRHYGCELDAETEVTITSGASEALFDAILACVGPGDEVIILEPAYDSYAPSIKLAGGHTIRVPLQPGDYTIDWQRLSDAINDKTRMLIINTPHNPCGSTLTADDLSQLAALVRDTDILLLSDEVYEHMVYDGESHCSVLSHPELRERSFAVFSFGKTYHATGWKLAYCVAPPALSTELRKIHQFVTFTSPSFIQYALADFMRECPEHATELPAFYQQKRDVFCGLLEKTRFRFRPSKGTYFQLANYGEISPLPDMEFVSWLTREIGVAAIPLSPFYQKAPTEPVVRFCFCKDDDTLTRAAEKLATL